MIAKIPKRKPAQSADDRVERAARAVMEDPDRYGGPEALIVIVSQMTLKRLEEKRKQ